MDKEFSYFTGMEVFLYSTRLHGYMRNFQTIDDTVIINYAAPQKKDPWKRYIRLPYAWADHKCL